MKARYQKFQESLQAGVKLSIAVGDCFLPDLPEKYRTAYEAYLRQRLGPAAELLAESEDLDRLDRLWELEPFSEQLLNQLLRLCLRQHKNAAYVWALEKKQKTCGFAARDFSI